jgi:hypothetical protein
VGEDYYAEYVTVIDKLLYKNEVIAQMTLKADKETYNADSQVVTLIFPPWYPDEGKYYSSLGVYDFRIGNSCSKDDLRKFFGQETKDAPGFLYYQADENNYIKFTITNDVLERIEIAVDL